MDDTGPPPERVRVSVVVPAHDEQASIGDLLDALTAPGAGVGIGDVGIGDVGIEVVVICNGCTDATADVARGYGPDVTVLETPIPSKVAAMRLGDTVARYFPRVYADADVRLAAADVAALARAVETGPVLAAAPQRRLDLTGASVWVRAYYTVWETLPQMRTGLFARGVIAVSRAGFARLAGRPAMMSDDLCASEAFAASERVVVDAATVTVTGPRTLRDLLRRRIRVVTGNAQADEADVRGASARTSVGTLVAIVRARPALAPHVAVFLAVTVAARIGARRRIAAGDWTTWLRDESSRAR